MVARATSPRYQALLGVWTARFAALHRFLGRRVFGIQDRIFEQPPFIGVEDEAVAQAACVFRFGEIDAALAARGRNKTQAVLLGMLTYIGKRKCGTRRNVGARRRPIGIAASRTWIIASRTW